MTALGLRSAGRLALSPRRRPRSTVPPASPDQISSLAFWHDAEASPTIEASGVIERWDDLSGNGNHAGQAVSTERPLKVTDGEGRHVIRFDGIDDTLAVTSAPSLATGVTLFLVFVVRTRSDSQASSRRLPPPASTMRRSSACRTQVRRVANSSGLVAPPNRTPW